MTVQWQFPAQTYLDQLSDQDQRRVRFAVERAEAGASGPDYEDPIDVAGEVLQVLRAGPEYRVLLKRSGEDLTVVDVVRWGQIVGLQRGLDAARH